MRGASELRLDVGMLVQHEALDGTKYEPDDLRTSLPEQEDDDDEDEDLSKWHRDNLDKVPDFMDRRERILTDIKGDIPQIPWFRRNLLPADTEQADARLEAVPVEVATRWKKRRQTCKAHREGS